MTNYHFFYYEAQNINSVGRNRDEQYYFFSEPNNSQCEGNVLENISYIKLGIQVLEYSDKEYT